MMSAFVMSMSGASTIIRYSVVREAAASFLIPRRLAWDLLGHGRSPVPKDPELYSRDGALQDLDDILATLSFLDWSRLWDARYLRLFRLSRLILLAGYFAWALLTEFFLDAEVSMVARLGVGATLGGVIVLLVSIGREVVTKFGSERYQEVKR